MISPSLAVVYTGDFFLMNQFHMLNINTQSRNCISIRTVNTSLKTLQGTNSYWQLGQGHVEDRSVPSLADGALQMGTVRQLSGGGGHSAVVSGECGS